MRVYNDMQIWRLFVQCNSRRNLSLGLGGGVELDTTGVFSSTSLLTIGYLKPSDWFNVEQQNGSNLCGENSNDGRHIGGR